MFAFPAAFLDPAVAFLCVLGGFARDSSLQIVLFAMEPLFPVILAKIR